MKDSTMSDCPRGAGFAREAPNNTVRDERPPTPYNLSFLSPSPSETARASTNSYTTVGRRRGASLPLRRHAHRCRDPVMLVLMPMLRTKWPWLPTREIHGISTATQTGTGTQWWQRWEGVISGARDATDDDHRPARETLLKTETSEA